MTFTDQIKITDRLGFIHTVVIKHFPAIGLSIACTEHDERIASREYGRMIPPTGDCDKEWEQWEELFREWADGAVSDLTDECKSYFDKKTKPCK